MSSIVQDITLGAAIVAAFGSVWAATVTKRGEFQAWRRQQLLPLVPQFLDRSRTLREWVLGLDDEKGGDGAPLDEDDFNNMYAAMDVTGQQILLLAPVLTDEVHNVTSLCSKAMRNMSHSDLPELQRWHDEIETAENDLRAEAQRQLGLRPSWSRRMLRWPGRTIRRTKRK